MSKPSVGDIIEYGGLKLKVVISDDDCANATCHFHNSCLPGIPGSCERPIEFKETFGRCVDPCVAYIKYESKTTKLDLTE